MVKHNDIEVYGVIYMVTNKINGKIYIGQTTNWITRLKAYGKLHCKNQPKLYNSLKKYGIDSFSFEVIDTAVDKTQMKLGKECQSLKNGDIYNV